MKRYLVFVCPNYYPGGGWTDFVGDFDTASEAFAEADKQVDDYHWTQVIDTTTKEEIERPETINDPHA